jgi:hypothetical protein
VDDDRSQDRLILVPAYWWTHNQYALMRNESKFRSRDQRPVKLQTFEFSPFAPDTAGEMVAAIGLIERWTGMSFLAASGSGAAGAAGGTAEEDFVLLGRKILDECEGEPDFEVCARKVENSSRPALVVKPRRARESYYEMLVWYAGKAILDYAISRGGLGDVFESLRRDLADPRTADGDPRLGQAWENLGGQLVPMSRLEVLLGMAERGELNTWKEMHAEYAVLSAHYARDKARHAWETLRTLPRLRSRESLKPAGSASPDGKGRGEESGEAFGGPPLERADIASLLRALSALTHRVEKEVLASRRKDFQNHFRKATFRSEAEMKAVLGTVENNAFVKSTKIAMAAMRDDIDRILGALLA